MRLTALLGALAIVATAPGSASETVRMRVSPDVGVEPAWITVQLSVEPHADNRGLFVEIDSEALFRSSRVELQGDRAPRTNVFQYRGLPAGEYEVRAAVIGANGRERAVARRFMIVVP
jgi:hypothetical protein